MGALLEQFDGGFKKIAKEIQDALEKHKKVICGRWPQLHEIVKLLRSLQSMPLTFFCLGALDECAALN